MLELCFSRGPSWCLRLARPASKTLSSEADADGGTDIGSGKKEE